MVDKTLFGCFIVLIISVIMFGCTAIIFMVQPGTMNQQDSRIIMNGDNQNMIPGNHGMNQGNHLNPMQRESMVQFTKPDNEMNCPGHHQMKSPKDGSHGPGPREDENEKKEMTCHEKKPEKKPEKVPFSPDDDTLHKKLIYQN
ncbi:hypothetical protein [Methanospirillum hungatei]|uniref:hypothetical protein n=1 Tax=Methanospirillum hungatei TaxID=2203 RepID=UPI0026EA7714|nr:hypothetical protein [Methanospirillum hungatei]MCA1915857.1 hypothetical protein [Methanospirillum hungatei]